ncbi:hypothetical protein PHISCL_07276 [Aspergillus sclerotialis]|uniref:Uncharacterized protein n=1 Tax=Aspergillus sclerotialis TaxID=2070753 RepID=A0A3A2ZCN2_9EURO|nr:hypothetical protein PHISCL_07276 [Aspergillus sclerotialis]
MNSTDSSSLGTIHTGTSHFSLPNIPPIFYEWAAILPLAIYLANPEQAHELAGKASLSDCIRAVPFPRLGVLAHIAQLVQEGPDFLDRVSSLGGLRYEVWDTNWGSVFPCANGSASRIVTAFALRRSPRIAVPENVVVGGDGIKWSSSSSSTGSLSDQVSTDKAYASATELESKPQPKGLGTGGFRRYQTLHVLRFSREGNRNADRQCDKQMLVQKHLHRVCELVLALALTAAAAVSVVFGLYGTAVSLVTGIVARTTCRLIVLQRSSLYLHDNEEGKMDGCMLSAIHQNASTWYLYTGDRGVIDGLLNKPMVMSAGPPRLTSRSPIPAAAATTAMAYFIRFLSILQLAAVTYVTAQKGWDCIGLLCFILLSMLLDRVGDGHADTLARRWLQKHRVRIEVGTFIFSGRVAMIGAIQVFKRNDESSWMDGILQRNPRRDALLSALSEPEDRFRERLAVLDENERRGVERNVVVARQAAELMQKHFTSV